MFDKQKFLTKRKRSGWTPERLWVLGLLAVLLFAGGKVRAQIFFGPPNDDLTNAWVLVGDSGTTNGDNFNATVELGEPLHWYRTANNSVWFRWAPTNSGFATFDTVGSSFDTVLAVYSQFSFGTNPPPPTFLNLFSVGANDDFNPPGSPATNLTSSLTFFASSFSEYFIAVSGFSESGSFFSFRDEGPYVLNWNFSGVSTNAAPTTNQVQFLLADYTVAEDAPGFATITVGYNNTNPPGPVTVDYATHDGSAVAGVDYLDTHGTLVFLPGETVKTFSVPILDNAVVNSNLTVNLSLTNVTGGAALGPQAVAVLTINDDETQPPPNIAGEFQFSRPIYHATENAWASSGGSIWSTTSYFDNYRNIPGALITVTRTGSARGKVMVDYYTTNKLDLNYYFGTDFFFFNPFFGFNFNFFFNFSFFNSFFFNSLDTRMADEFFEYTPVSGTLVFDDYQMSTNFIVPIGSSSFLLGTNMNLLVPLVLANPRPAPEEDPNLIQPVLGATNQAVLNIIQTDGFIQVGTSTNLLGGFSIERAHYRMNEYGGTSTGRNSITINVILPGGGGAGVDVTLSTWDGYGFLVPDEGSDYADSTRIQFPNTPVTDGSPTLINPQDYVSQDAVLSFPNGNVTVRTVVLVCLDDSVVEFNEDIQLYLHDPHNAPLGPNTTANLTILYDEQPPGAADREWNPSDVTYSTPPFNRVPGANNTVYATAVQPDQKTLIAGEFTSYNAEPRNRVARLFPNGFLDPTFNPGTGADGFVAALALYSDHVTSAITASRDSIYIGGGFSSYNGTQRNGIARLTATGALDPTFNPGLGANGPVLSIAIQTDGKIVIAGDFTTYNGQRRNHLARLNEDGTLDPAFHPGDGADAAVWSVAVRDFPVPIFAPRVAEGNEFEDINDIETGANQGVISINYEFFFIPDTIRVYYDGNLLLNQTLNGNGVLNVPYGPGNSTQVRITMNEGQGIPGTAWNYTASITPVIPERTLFIGGDFTTYDGQFRFGVARLRDDGSLDPTFNPGAGANNSVYAVAVQPDGKLLAGGAFTDFDFVPLHSIARLNLNGTVDTTFQPGDGFDDVVYSIVLQPDMKPILGGIFTEYNQTRRVGLARLLTSGALDTGFMDTAFNQFAGVIPNYYFEPPHYINSISLETNGNLIIGGSFTNLGGNAAFQVNDTFGPFNTLGQLPWTRSDKITRFNVARLIGTWGVESNTVTVITTNNNVVTTNINTIISPNAPQGPGNVEFITQEYSIDENAGNLAVTLHRVDGRLGTVGADLGSTNRLAIAGVHYEAVDTNSIWPEFAFAAPIHVGWTGLNYLNVGILDELIIEGDHSFDLGFFNPFGSINLGGEIVPLGAGLARRSSRVRIVDNDFTRGELAFTQPVFTVDENGVRATVNVIRTNGNTGQISVDYFTEDTAPATTATPGADYTPAQGTLTFLSGQTNRQFTIPIFNDTMVEFDENIRLVLTNATGGATLPEGLPTSIESALLTIIDDDFKPGRLNFSQIDYVTNENAGFARITVTRSGGNQTEMRVTAVANSGTAVAGVNFVPVTNRLVWAHLDSSPKSFDVPLVHDGAVIGPLTVDLRLFDPTVSGTNNPVALGNRNTATLTILDEDAHGGLAFSSPAYAADENGAAAIITIVRTGGIAGEVGVDYLTGENSAAAGFDYVSTGGTLTLASGQLSTNFSVQLIDNDFIDGDRDLRLILTNATGGAVITNPAVARLTIIDNESSAIPAGTLDSTFNENGAIGANDSVFALALQPDGKMLMAGEFTRVNQIPRHRLARLTPEANLDGVFNAGEGPNDAIRAMLLEPDGRIVLGGFFTVVSGTNRNHIVRLNADGSVDAFFNPGAGADNPVMALARQPDGRILVGGSFTLYNGVSRPYLARVNTNGSLHAAFDTGAGPNASVFALAVQPDGKILIGGDFTTVNNTNRNRIARLLPNGALDLTFDPGLDPLVGPESDPKLTGASGTVRTILVQADGKILIGGLFTNYNGMPRNYLARLNQDGSLDTTYLAGQSGANDAVFVLAAQADGKILVGGNFTRFNGVTRKRLTRLNEDGSTDPTINFGAGANGFVASLLVQPDRKIVLGGGFTEVQDRPRLRIARVHGGSIAGAGTLEFNRANYTVDESAEFASVSVQRRGGTTGQVSIRAWTTNGAALAGLDFTDVSEPLVFPQGETFQSLIVPIIDDTLVEPPETVELALSDPVGAALGAQPTARLTIVSDDSAIGFPNQSISANENVQSGFATVAIVRTGATNSDVSAFFSTQPGGSATPGLDYSNVPPTQVRFIPGETNQTLFVPIINDLLVEGEETVRLALTNAFPTNIASLAISNATLNIVDDDFAVGVIAFGTSNYVVLEDATNAVISVIRRNGANGIVSVHYATSNGTARAGRDYLATGGVLAFGDGETMKTFTVPIINNAATNIDRTINLTLFNPSGGATLGESNAVLTITDDEIGPSFIGFTTTNFVVNEVDAFAVISVTRTNSRRGEVSVDYATLDGSALDGQDYTAQSGTLTLEDGESTKVFTVPLLNDSLGEGDETVRLVLSNPQPAGGAFLSLSNSVITILSEDTSLSFATDAYEVNEAETNVVVSVVRRGVTNTAVSVTYSTVPGGTAIAGLDYVPVTGTLNWASNDVAPKTFDLAIIDNTEVGPNQTIFLALSNAVGLNAQVGLLSNTVVTVVNDEIAGPVAGGADPTFNGNFGANAAVYAITFADQERVYAGGDFTLMHGLAVNRLARLNGDGTVDRTFDIGTGFDQTVYALAVSSNGPVVVGGSFTNYNGQPFGRVAMLQPDGTPVTGFNFTNGANGTVRAVAVEPLPTLNFSRFSFQGVQNSDTNTIPVGANAGTVSLDFTFQAYTNLATNVAGIFNDLRIYYDGFVIWQTNVFVGTNDVSGSALASFGPGVATDLIVTVNEGSTNGTTWQYNGAIAIGAATDRKLLIAGDFTLVNGEPMNRVARLNGDGTLDNSFSIGSGANRIVYALARQTNGQVIIGGDFLAVDDIFLPRLARLNLDGSLDVSFNPRNGADAAVRAIALQPDGRIIVAGDFETFNGVPRHHIARLNPDASVDLTFDPGAGADGPIHSVSIQSDGKILVVGAFARLNGNLSRGIGRFNPDGSVDANFNIGRGANAPVHAVALARLASSFTVDRQASGTQLEDRFTVDTGATSGTIIIDYDFLFVPDNLRIYYEGNLLFDLTTNGTDRVTVNFGPGTSTLVTIVINEGIGQPGTAWFYTLTINTGARVDNEFVVGGEFTEINDEPRGRIALVTSSGALDPNFYPSGTFNDVVYALGLHTNRMQAATVGKVVVGGDFDSLVGVSPVNNVARLNLDGTFDKTFRIGAGTDGAVRAVAVQPDGKVILGGAFTSVDVFPRRHLARLKPDGVLDQNYNPGSGPDGTVLSMALQPDGRLVIGGTFTTAYGASRNRIARMKPDGTVDATFDPGGGANGAVKAVVLQPDGKVLLGGDFTVVNGVPYQHLARLLPDGSVDLTFAGWLGPNGPVESIALQADGQIVIGGSFTAVNQTAITRIARLNPDGTLDPTFDPGAGPDDYVSSIVVQPDGRLVVGGAFTVFNGQLRHRLARLTAAGALDPTIGFGTGANNYINTVLRQDYDGKIVVGGGFTAFAGEVRVALARVFDGGAGGPGRFQFGAPEYTVSEDATNLWLTVVRVDGAEGAASVSFSTSDNSARAGTDFVGTNGVLNFAAAESFKTVPIRILDNTITNTARDFGVILFGPTGGATLGDPMIATVNIAENDSVFSFSQPTYAITEGSTPAARITVVRHGGNLSPATVDYFTTTNGSALPFFHYLPVAASLVFNPLVNSRTFDVPIFDEALIEGNLTIDLALTNVTGPASLGLSHATLIRIDDETGPGVLTFPTNSFFVNEGVSNGLLRVSVVRTNGSSGVVSARYTTLNGTAGAGVRYVGTNGILTFADGETNKTLLVPIIDGPDIEGDQTFFLRLTEATGGATLGQSLAVVTVQDNDSNGAFRFQSAVLQTNENAGVARIVVERVGGSIGEVSVTYRSSGGTALPGIRYLSVSNVLTFAEGDTTRTFDITLINNTNVQDVETVQLILSDPTGGAIITDPGVALLEIVDDEVGLTFSAPGYSVVETNDTAVISVTRLGNTNVPVSVNFETTDGTAEAGVPPEVLDYRPSSGTLSFAPGETNLQFVVEIINDSQPEIDEALNLTLSNPLNLASNATAAVILGPDITVPLTIVDDDVSFEFSAAVYPVVEAFFTNVTIQVNRFGGTNFPASVNYATSDGTAVEFFKYFPAAGVLNYLPGQTSNSFEVTILDDLIAQGNQTVNLSLSDPSANAIISGQATAIILILDDEKSVGFSQTNYVVSEKGTNAVITLVRNGLPDGAVSIVINTTDGTAVAGMDYLTVSNVVTWADQDLTNKTVRVPILTNAIVEGTKTLNLQLSFPVGVQIDPNAGFATLDIVDNAGLVAFSSANYRVTEGEDLRIPLLRTGGTNGTVSVDYFVSGGSATPGIDFTNASGTVAFGHGEARKTLVLPIRADGAVEGLETAILRLGNPKNGVLVGQPAAAAVDILDQDVGIIESAGTALEIEGFAPANGFIDPDEPVTVQFALRNRGTVNTTNLTATLLATNGIHLNGAPSVTVDYGVLVAQGPIVSRPFAFRAMGAAGSTVTAVFELHEGPVLLDRIQVAFTLGEVSLTFENADPITINDLAPATPYPSVITVSNVAGLVSNITVTIQNVRHNYPADIDLALEGPNGRSIILMSDAGGGEPLNNVTLIFDDAATASLPERTQIVSGRYRPSNYQAFRDFFPPPGPGFTNGISLVDFLGIDPNGKWSLFGLDDLEGQAGVIAGGWSISINGGATFTPAADLSVTSLAAPSPVQVGGQLTYTVYATNHGPSLARNVMLTNLLPANVTLLQAGASQGSVSVAGAEVVASVGNLEVGAFAWMSNVVTVPNVSTTLTNFASVGAAASDPNPGNNADAAKTDVLEPPMLAFNRKDDFLDISWPVDAGNFILESTLNLFPADWQPVPGVPLVVNGRYVVRVNATSGGTAYYRLSIVP